MLLCQPVCLLCRSLWFYGKCINWLIPAVYKQPTSCKCMCYEQRCYVMFALQEFMTFCLQTVEKAKRSEISQALLDWSDSSKTTEHPYTSTFKLVHLHHLNSSTCSFSSGENKYWISVFIRNGFRYYSIRRPLVWRHICQSEIVLIIRLFEKRSLPSGNLLSPVAMSANLQLKVIRNDCPSRKNRESIRL